MTHVLEYLGKDSKSAIITIIHEVKVNTLERNGKVVVLSRKIETIKKIARWKTDKYNTHYLEGINSRIDMTEERGLKTNQQKLSNLKNTEKKDLRNKQGPSCFR